MITLEQIRLLESKITRAIDLIRVLKEENAALRKGLDSTQVRMKELESLVDGFKSDQREIESVIVRALHSLDDLEESAMAAKRVERVAGPQQPAAAPTAVPPSPPGRAEPVRAPRRAPAEEPTAEADPHAEPHPQKAEPPSAKEELDIF